MAKVGSSATFALASQSQTTLTDDDWVDVTS
jgi:hypothetical protein